MRLFYLFENNYRGSHRAPSKGYGAPLHDMAQLYPDDIYGPHGARYYGHGNDVMDNQSIFIIRWARGKPHARIKIYRAVPDINKEVNAKIKRLGNLVIYVSKHGFTPMGDEQARYQFIALNRNKEAYIEKLREEIEKLDKVKEKPLQINPGDWVTITRQYAVLHGEHTLEGNYKILTKTVKASELYTEGNSIHEFGYDPS